MSSLEKLSKLISSKNIAADLDDEKLEKIGQQVFRNFENDLKSRESWEEQVQSWVKMATLISERKTYPWPNAANVKYPLVSTAAMQFASRAYPSLIPPTGTLVHSEVIGKDPDGAFEKAARRIDQHMTYQLRHDMENFEADMDKLLLNIAIMGTCFKKTYYDTTEGKQCSHIVYAKDLIVNFWAKSSNKTRYTEVIPLTKNDVVEKVREGSFIDVDLGDPSRVSFGQLHTNEDFHGQAPEEADDTTPYIMLEQHWFLDLDEDGYAEPYIITIEYKTKKVVQIIARYSADDVTFSEEKNNKVVRIKPLNYYTKYGFIPSFDGSYYDLGFGQLLGPLNESANTLLNQIIDSGTLYNLQSGFLSRGLTMQSGNTPFKPGEWKVTNTTMDDLRKGIVPLPVREPSKVLYELLGLIVQSGKELASVAEIMVGKMPGQNTPATTTQTAVEEGMRLFTAIYKRIYRSFTKELKLIYKLNAMYLAEDEEARILRDPELAMLGKDDYELENIVVMPSADPAVASQAQKIAKSQSLLQLIPSGVINIQEAILRALEAQEQPNIEKLLQPNPPKPNPEEQKMQMEMQIKQAEAAMKKDLEEAKVALKQQEAQLKMEIESIKAQNKLQSDRAQAQLKLMVAKMEAQMELRSKEMEHGQQMRQMSEQMRMEQLSNDLKMDTERKKAKAQADNIETKSVAQEKAAKRKRKYQVKKTGDGYEVSSED